MCPLRGILALDVCSVGPHSGRFFSLVLDTQCLSAGRGFSSVGAWYATALDIEDVLGGAAERHSHIFVADVIKSFGRFQLLCHLAATPAQPAKPAQTTSQARHTPDTHHTHTHPPHPTPLPTAPHPTPPPTHPTPPTPTHHPLPLAAEGRDIFLTTQMAKNRGPWARPSGGWSLKSPILTTCPHF